jgi:hypothetical protein
MPDRFIEHIKIMGNKKSILLRINPDLWNDLNRWANDELRSVNAQIEYLLREAVRKRKREREK